MKDETLNQRADYILSTAASLRKTRDATRNTDHRDAINRSINLLLDLYAMTSRSASARTLKCYQLTYTAEA